MTEDWSPEKEAREDKLDGLMEEACEELSRLKEETGMSIDEMLDEAERLRREDPEEWERRKALLRQRWKEQYPSDPVPYWTITD